MEAWKIDFQPVTLTQRLNVSCEADNEDGSRLQTATLQTLESENTDKS